MSSYEESIKLKRKLKQFDSCPSIDFYLLNYYSLNFTDRSLFANEFNLYNPKAKYNIYFNLYFGISSIFLIKYYQSILIVPAYFLAIKLTTFISSIYFERNDCSKCYWCNQSRRYEHNKVKFKILKELIEFNKETICK